MANPNPRLDNLKPFERFSDRELGKIIGTRYPLDVEKALDEITKKQQFIRLAVEEKLKREGLLEG